MIVVELDKPSPFLVTVNYAVSSATGSENTNEAIGGGVDYTLPNGTITFESGETSKSFTIDIIDDNIYEGSEYVYIQLSSPVNAVLSSIDRASFLTLNSSPKP